MTIIETALVFAGIPLAIILVLVLAVYGGSEMRNKSTARYRPGRPWDYQPVWYLPHPDSLARLSAAGGHSAELESSPAHAALPGQTSVASLPGQSSAAPTPTAVGGASGEW
jgi:hypothetical protein